MAKLIVLFYLILILLTMLFYQGFFIFIRIIDLHILILVVIAQIFNPVPKLAIPIVIQTKEAKS